MNDHQTTDSRRLEESQLGLEVIDAPAPSGVACRIEESQNWGRLARHITGWVPRTLLGLALSGVLLYLAVRNADLSKTLYLILGINPLYTVLSGLLYLAATWIRAWRWSYLFTPVRLRIAKLFAATAVGYMMNNLLPARLGDVVRAYFLAQRENVRFIPAFATIMVERTLDVFGLLILIGVTSFFVPYPSWIARGIYGGAGLGIGMAVVLVGLRLFPDRCEQMVKRLEVWLPKRLEQRLSRAISSFISGLGALKMGRHLASIFLISVALWICYFLFVVSVFWSFGWTMPLGASWAVLVFMSLAMMIPSAPGQLGAVQFFVVLALALYGLKGDAALGFSVVLHGVTYVTTIAAGLFCLVGQQVSLFQLARLGAPRT